MNSIIHIILAIKLKFILIILSIGTTYFLEHHANTLLSEKTESVVSIQDTCLHEVIIANLEQDTPKSSKQVYSVDKSRQDKSESNSCGSGLGRLGLYIEL